MLTSFVTYLNELGKVCNVTLRDVVLHSCCMHAWQASITAYADRQSIAFSDSPPAKPAGPVGAS